VLPWHLSFCRLGKQIPRYCVDGDSRMGLLPAAARRGDIVLFGGCLSTNLFFVDTILCVARAVSIPHRNGEFVLRERFDEYWRSVFRWRASRADWNLFTVSRSFLHGLVDCLPEGMHHSTGADPHLQLLGRRKTPMGLSRSALLSDFLRGRGFNCIPLRKVPASTRVDVLARPGLFTAQHHHLSHLLKHKVALLPSDHGVALLETVLRIADTLVLDPLIPTHIGPPFRPLRRASGRRSHR